MALLLFLMYPSGGQLLKKFATLEQEFIPLKVDPVLENVLCPRKQTGIFKSCFPL